MDHRTCRKCGVSKPLEKDFYADSRSPGGRRTACKDCHRADVAARYNPELKRRANRRYYEERKEELRAKERFRYYENYDANRERWSARNAARSKDYAETTCSECGETYKPRRLDQVGCSARCSDLIWAKGPGRDSRRASMRKVRNKRKSALSVPYRESDIFERDNWQCQICSLPINPELSWPDYESKSIDHILPLALGGADAAWNVQAAHLQCNRVKGAKVA